MKGKLIVIEGTDGTGKETQTIMLSKALRNEGITLKELHFPCYGTTACGPVEIYLRGDFGKKAGDVSPYAASTMYAIDRFASMKTDWGKFYEEGGLLLSDHYTTSNVVLQGGKLQEPQRSEYLSWLYDLEYTKMGLPVPDMVFFIYMPPEVINMRLASRSGKDGIQNDIYETDTSHLASCNNSTLEIAKKSGWIIIQAATADGKIRTSEDIHAEILGFVRQFLAPKKPDGKGAFLIYANYGEWDDARDCPIMMVSDETLVKSICRDFEDNDSSVYRQMVRDALEIKDVSNVSLGYTTVPFITSLDGNYFLEIESPYPNPFGPDDGNIFTRLTQLEAILENLSDEYTSEEVRELERELSWIRFVVDLWESLENTPYDNETECIKAPWNKFPADTYRPEIWEWFESTFGVKLEQLS